MPPFVFRVLYSKALKSLCCSYCGLCESLVRSLRRFPLHKLRVFKEKIFLHLDDPVATIEV